MRCYAFILRIEYSFAIVVLWFGKQEKERGKCHRFKYPFPKNNIHNNKLHLHTLFIHLPRYLLREKIVCLKSNSFIPKESS